MMLRTKPAWIIQAPGVDANDGRGAFTVFAARQSRAALGAKTALVMADRGARRKMITRPATGELKRISRRDDDDPYQKATSLQRAHRFRRARHRRLRGRLACRRWCAHGYAGAYRAGRRTGWRGDCQWHLSANPAPPTGRRRTPIRHDARSMAGHEGFILLHHPVARRRWRVPLYSSSHRKACWWRVYFWPLISWES
jgi:hypothetical protein